MILAKLPASQKGACRKLKVIAFVFGSKVAFGWFNDETSLSFSFVGVCLRSGGDGSKPTTRRD
jgi:hypothetical protein